MCHVWRSTKDYLHLKNSKESLSYSILVKICNTFNGSFLTYLTGVISQFIATSLFPDKLKLAKVMSVFKNICPLDKKSYRPINLVSHTSKNILKKNTSQPNQWLYKNLFSPGFWRNNITQHWSTFYRPIKIIWHKKPLFASWKVGWIKIFSKIYDFYSKLFK